MGCHKCVIYTRMLFYLSVIAIHGGNGVVLLHSFNEENMKNKGVRDYYETKYFFFTTWNFIFQIAYAAFALFCDWMSLKNTDEKKTVLPEVVSEFREKVFTVVVWPSTLLASTYFWGFYAYDRNLLYPEYFDTVVTHTSNHILHTLIIPIVLCEMVLYPRRKPDSSAVRLFSVVGLEALYVCTLFYIHYTKGIWIYPLIAIFNENTVCFAAFLVLTALYLTVLYYSQFCVSAIVLKCREKIGERFCKACKK